MDALTELDVLAYHMKQAIPDADIKLLNLPEQPTNNMLWIDTDDSRDTTPGQSVSLIRRRWKMAFYHEHKARVVAAMDKLQQLFSNDAKLAYELDGKTYYVTMKPFSSGAINETESGHNFSFSILETATHGYRITPEVDKIGKVVVKMPINLEFETKC